LGNRRAESEIDWPIWPVFPEEEPDLYPDDAARDVLGLCSGKLRIRSRECISF
jgi:hypothetical protein